MRGRRLHRLFEASLAAKAAFAAIQAGTGLALWLVPGAALDRWFALLASKDWSRIPAIRWPIRFCSWRRGSPLSSISMPSACWPRGR